MSESTQVSSVIPRNERSDDNFPDVSDEECIFYHNDVEDNDFLFIESGLNDYNNEKDVSLNSSESVSSGIKEDENSIYDKSLCSKLRHWGLANRCSRQFINGVLKLFLECNQNVPTGSRTLLKTKRSIAIINIEGHSDYIYLGLKTN